MQQEVVRIGDMVPFFYWTLVTASWMDSAT